MSGTTTDDYLKKLDEALEVAAVLFPIGITKSHPPISEHLSEPAKDFLDRDFLSVDKRYPKLYVSPEFSKVVVHWPMENLKLPLRTPVRIINSVKNRNVGRVTTYYSMILIRTTNQRSFGIRFKTVIILGNKTFHAMTIESD